MSPAGVRVHGTSRVLVVLARFADGAPEPVSSGSVRAQLFGGADGGPVAQSFALASGGSFTLRGEVTPWFTTSITVAASRGPGTVTPSGLGDYIVQALVAADERVDFGLYDNDGPDGRPNSGDDDGVVDGGVVVLNSEHNLYCDGGTGRGPHPHAVTQWSVNGQRFLTGDASRRGGVVEIGGYTTMSATGCSPQSVASHILAHELGHLLFRLPDLYHSIGSAPAQPWTVRHWVVGCWELMAAGSWGCGSGPPTFDTRFATFGAWTRFTVGWTDPTIVPVGTDAEYELLPLDRGGTALRLTISQEEYVLIEYREGAPGDLLPGNGVLMYHIAESLPLYPPMPGGRYRISLIEADDDSALFRTELQGGNRGAVGDAFGITRTTFRPGEHSRAVAVDGSPFPFEVTEISIDAAAHRARLRISPAPIVALR